jgi:hypothetical protein
MAKSQTTTSLRPRQMRAAALTPAARGLVLVLGYADRSKQIQRRGSDDSSHCLPPGWASFVFHEAVMIKRRMLSTVCTEAARIKCRMRRRALRHGGSFVRRLPA